MVAAPVPARIGAAISFCLFASLPLDSIVRIVRDLDFSIAPWDWPFSRERRADIDAFWRTAKAAAPALFNGRVLLLNAFTLGDRRCSGTFFETDYSDFIAWKTWGAPAAGAWNGFGMGALRASDGAFMLGCMGAHTFNAGAVYFPSGTPDRDDIVGGRVDLAGSVTREVAEETGLTSDDYRIAGDWTIVCHGAQVAAIRCLDLSLTAETARLKILAHLGCETEPELSDIRIVRGPADLEPAMPPFVIAYLNHVWDSKGRRG
jgi:8-oxo-dGTP pyrophosphatase MutT (NUDIX family)